MWYILKLYLGTFFGESSMHLRSGDVVKAVHPIYLKEKGVAIPLETQGIVEDAPKHQTGRIVVAWEVQESGRPTTVSGPVLPHQVSVVH